MAKRTKPLRGGLSPAKAVLIGVLAVVLLLAIVAQFGGQRKPDAALPDARQATSERSAETTTSEPAAPAAAMMQTENRWPNFNVAEVVASNPFMLPEVLRPRREVTQTLTPSSEQGGVAEDIAVIESAGDREMRRRRAEFMTSLRAKGVDMILRSPRGSVARIGDLTLRVGDVHEGLRVESISQNGVVFSPAVVADGQRE